MTSFWTLESSYSRTVSMPGNLSLEYYDEEESLRTYTSRPVRPASLGEKDLRAELFLGKHQNKRQRGRYYELVFGALHQAELYMHLGHQLTHSKGSEALGKHSDQAAVVYDSRLTSACNWCLCSFVTAGGSKSGASLRLTHSPQRIQPCYICGSTRLIRQRVIFHVLNLQGIQKISSTEDFRTNLVRRETDVTAVTQAAIF
ncbi:hypothetical protein C8J56DRAFT_883445 [Mycena floridula]|nr:hypothetical protein C8J56DRAFT_883445 [Mycena floridula]